MILSRRGTDKLSVDWSGAEVQLRREEAAREGHLGGLTYTRTEQVEGGSLGLGQGRERGRRQGLWKVVGLCKRQGSPATRPQQGDPTPGRPCTALMHPDVHRLPTRDCKHATRQALSDSTRTADTPKNPLPARAHAGASPECSKEQRHGSWETSAA